MQRRTIVWLVLHAWVRWKRLKRTQHLFTLLLLLQHDKVCGHFSTPVIHDLSSDIISACAPFISNQKVHEWMKHNYKENEIISSIFFLRLIAQLVEPVLIFQKGDEKYAHTHTHKHRHSSVIHEAAPTTKKSFPVLAVLIQAFFHFLSSKQKWNKRSYYHVCGGVCLCACFNHFEIIYIRKQHVRFGFITQSD